MSKKMTFFCIITNSDKKDNYEKASEIKKYLENKACVCTILENKLTQDRGRKFSLDAVDVDETNFVATASTVMGE